MCGGGGEIRVRSVDNIQEFVPSFHCGFWGTNSVQQLSCLTSLRFILCHGLKGQGLTVIHDMKPPLLTVQTLQLTLNILFSTVAAAVEAALHPFIDA